MSTPYNEEEIKAKLEKLEDDDFKDAVQEDDDEGVKGEFKVTDEELAIIRAELATEFPDDYLYLSDAYILSVASKPYSKEPTKRRPIEYSQEKLQHVMTWRAEAGAPDMEERLKLAAGPSNSAAAIAAPEIYPKACAMVKSLNTGSIYWHGFTKDGRPILWIRTNRKPWYPDVEAECAALILMADAGIQTMPSGVTDFCVIAESSYPPPPNPSFMIALLKALVRGYPDRLHILYSAPVSSIVQFVMGILLPLMPGRLASKVCLLGTEEAKKTLTPLLLNGVNDLPEFLGGPCMIHDTYYPEESKCTLKDGGGILKFDYFGMMERLQAARDEYLLKRATAEDDDDK
jgi:CRAL/TRIO domain